MNFWKNIKEGIKTLNRNYQLLIIHGGLLFLAFFLFVIIVGVPLIIVATKTGLDISRNHLNSVLESILKEDFSAYKYLILTLLLSLLIYVLTIGSLFIYTLGGTAGIIIRAVSGKGDYQWRSFAEYGKGLFRRLLGLGVLWVVLLIIISFLAGALGGIAKVMTTYKDNFFKDFLINLFNLTAIVFSFGMVILFMAVFTYGIGFIILKNTGPISALKESINFISRLPISMLYYLLLILGAIGIMFFSGMIGLLFKGPLSMVFYQLVFSMVQIYLNLAILSCAFSFMKEQIPSTLTVSSSATDKDSSKLSP